jgi:ligand-binding SRPBCC domain-containing protein
LGVFVYSSVIAAPLERVFAFHERPDAFALLAPPWAGIEVIRREGGLEVGAETLISMPLLPFLPQSLSPKLLRLEWLARHTEYDPPKLFVDEQVSGPFRYWRHEHKMEAVGGGTLLSDYITFCLPGGVIVDGLGAGFVRMGLRRVFSFRHMMTKNYCE